MAPPPVGRKLNDNKPGEPDFQLKVDPEIFVIFKPPAGGSLTSGNAIIAEIKIINITDKRQTYKVKCTSNEIFRVRPPIGYVNPGETMTLKVLYQSMTPQKNNRHFFAIYHFKTTETTKPARSLWTADAKPEGVKRLLAQFENADGTPVESAPNPGAPK